MVHNLDRQFESKRARSSNSDLILFLYGDFCQHIAVLFYHAEIEDIAKQMIQLSFMENWWDPILAQVDCISVKNQSALNFLSSSLELNYIFSRLNFE
jgi:hypothetical protein